MKEGEGKKAAYEKKDHFHNKASEGCFSSLKIKLFGSGAKYQGGIKKVFAKGRPLSELQTRGATDVGETEGQQ